MGSFGPVSTQVVVTDIAECIVEIDVLIIGNNSLDRKGCSQWGNATIRIMVVAQGHNPEPMRPLQCSHIVTVKPYRKPGKGIRGVEGVRGHYNDQIANGGRGV